MNSVVFCGFGIIGYKSLKALFENGYRVLCVLTHQEQCEQSVDTFAKNQDIRLIYSDIRKDSTLLSEISALKAKFLVSVNYRYILPRPLLDSCAYSVNLHGSLLPKYRGRTPHVWSIINGEEFTGITAHIMEETVDSGDIINQKKIRIHENDTGYTLLQKFEKYYPGILLHSLHDLESGKKLIKQDNSHASYYVKREPDMGYIDFYKNSKQVINFVRAQANPYPGAYYYLINGDKIIINKIRLEKNINLDIAPGVVAYYNNCYYVKCLDGLLKIQDYEIR